MASAKPQGQGTQPVVADQSCLPSCFGISGSRRTNEKRRFSWWRSRMRKSGSKTVPVDISGVQKAIRARSRGSEVEEKAEGKRQIAEENILASVAAVPDAAVVGKSKKQPKYRNGHLSAAVGVNNPECASPIPKDAATPATAPSSPLFPPARRQQQPPARASRLSGQRYDQKTDKLNGRLAPVVGLSVLVVILAIMLIWGRTCAILCTSAWFYFAPRLRVAGNSGEVSENLRDADKVDYDSEEYKKKVILEGLLERNKRRLMVVL